jgi:hypothetical protein
MVEFTLSEAEGSLPLFIYFIMASLSITDSILP